MNKKKGEVIRGATWFARKGYSRALRCGDRGGRYVWRGIQTAKTTLFNAYTAPT